MVYVLISIISVIFIWSPSLAYQNEALVLTIFTNMITYFKIRKNRIWRLTPVDIAVIPATKLPFTYRILTLSSRSRAVTPMTSWFKREKHEVIGATALERDECQNSVHERQLCSGDKGFVTWRSPSYVANSRRHMLKNAL